MEHAMGRFQFAGFAAAAATIACCAVPVHARDAPVRLAAEQLNQQLFEQKLRDTRANIKKEQTTTRPAGNTGASDQLVVDICKKNPHLPQCKFK